ncbi:hypothetical protein [Bifidobacterium cuniculi]|uniref:Uncharacterized protein n=1 Tax=Bifidobacterium cuniculi TaxID=1688 RepID=A0A087AWU0_9BIFI|nr:hypothetical protein [Bifidobacterium cuniculi]KFI63240.1 hypothetical protein BCUN_1169 [Bifidobacterium cuniculi]
MVNIQLTDTSLEALDSLIGDTFVSFECEGLHQDGTYGYLLLQTNRHRLQISNIQQELPGFDMFGDFPLLTCNMLKDHESFAPFKEQPLKKYPLYGTITDVDVINDHIQVPDTPQPICRTEAIDFHTDDGSVIVRVGPLFSEDLFITINDDGTSIPTPTTIADEWKEYPRDQVKVQRVTSSISSVTDSKKA